MYQIEKGIPIPKKSEKNGLTATLRDMEIGDSIEIPTKDIISITRISKDAGVKVTVRKWTETTHRVWRIK